MKLRWISIGLLLATNALSASSTKQHIESHPVFTGSVGACGAPVLISTDITADPNDALAVVGFLAMSDALRASNDAMAFLDCNDWSTASLGDPQNASLQDVYCSMSYESPRTVATNAVRSPELALIGAGLPTIEEIPGATEDDPTIRRSYAGDDPILASRPVDGDGPTGDDDDIFIGSLPYGLGIGGTGGVTLPRVDRTDPIIQPDMPTDPVPVPGAAIFMLTALPLLYRLRKMRG